MPTLDQIPAKTDPVHLMLVGDTKSGKSTYAAQAAIDGFTLLYIDADNGISALRHAFVKHPEAMSRVHYFSTSRPAKLLKGILRSTTKSPFRWIKDTDNEWGKLATDVTPDSIVWEFDITKVPPEWILVPDSWSSVASDALGIGNARQHSSLLDGTDQAVYGEANVNMVYLSNLIQKYPGHVIVQAHAGKYEIYEKPTGVVAGQMKQGQMTLREVLDVPVSSSNPNSIRIAKAFNHIGWLSVNHLGQTIIDFERKPNRVGGGPPNRKDVTDKLRFLHLAGGVLPEPTDSTGWFRETTHAELVKK